MKKKPEKLLNVPEQDLVSVIERWRFDWSNVINTNPRDAENYRRRASGIDANMIYDLARKIKKEFNI